MTEKELLAQIVIMLNERPALLWSHFPDSRKQMGTRGLPDLIIVGCYGVLWRELKVRYGKPEGDQVRWKYALRASGQNYAVWTEWDLLSGGIATALDLIEFGSVGAIPHAA